MQNIINGSIEVIEQGEMFLQTVTPASYTKILQPFFTSSSGEHMRHILDHFLSLKAGLKSGIVDYDIRNRNSQIESDHSQALKQLQDIKNWVLSLNKQALDSQLQIKTEVSVSEKSSVLVPSNLARELIFATSHAVHHFSIISIAMQMQDFSVDKNFGIAPATATHLRDNEDSCAP